MNAAVLHEEAMNVAEHAFLQRRRGLAQEALELFRQAFELEREAALLMAGNLDAEPTRSVLLRSAATLAMHAGSYREAEKLASLGLAGEPPADIAEELRDVMEEVQRRLMLARADQTGGEPVEVTGKLCFADAASSWIQLADEAGNRVPYDIRVPGGLNGIVKKYWDETITVFGISPVNSRVLILQDIRRAG
ncbi:MAG: hypothetical protein NW241_18150 [Bacteroidia bacterium]|nr:hypothetical protein [Bacteroidia bacterium]